MITSEPLQLPKDAWELHKLLCEAIDNGPDDIENAGVLALRMFEVIIHAPELRKELRGRVCFRLVEAFIDLVHPDLVDPKKAKMRRR